jgi:tRNA 2-thiouridine synthesizing protein A
VTRRILDERGRLCPLPIMALGRALRHEPPGTLIELTADDPAVRTDVPAWCAMVGASLISVAEGEDGVITAVVELP